MDLLDAIVTPVHRHAAPREVLSLAAFVPPRVAATRRAREI